ncbi:lasso RiPP family leader peptide-containing protein [Nonomuraea sp. NPDC050643]
MATYERPEITLVGGFHELTQWGCGGPQWEWIGENYC